MERSTKELAEEEVRVARLRFVVDLTSAVIRQTPNLTLEEAQDLVSRCRERALELFPDKAETFDLIYGSRLRRLLSERFMLQ